MNVYTIDTSVICMLINNIGKSKTITPDRYNFGIIQDTLYEAKKKLIRFIDDELLIDLNSRVIITLALNTHSSPKKSHYIELNRNIHKRQPYAEIVKRLKDLFPVPNQWERRAISNFLQYFVTNNALSYTKFSYMLPLLCFLLMKHYKGNLRVHIMYNNNFTDRDINKLLLPYSLFPITEIKHHLITISQKIRSLQSKEYLITNFTIIHPSVGTFINLRNNMIIEPEDVNLSDNIKELLNSVNNMIDYNAPDEDKQKIVTEIVNICKNPFNHLQEILIKELTEDDYNSVRNITINKLHKAFVHEHVHDCKLMNELIEKYCPAIDDSLLVICFEGDWRNDLRRMPSIANGKKQIIRISKNEQEEKVQNEVLRQYCAMIWNNCEKRASKM